MYLETDAQYLADIRYAVWRHRCVIDFSALTLRSGCIVFIGARYKHVVNQGFYILAHGRVIAWLGDLPTSGAEGASTCTTRFRLCQNSQASQECD